MIKELTIEDQINLNETSSKYFRVEVWNTLKEDWQDIMFFKVWRSMSENFTSSESIQVFTIAFKDLKDY